MKNPNERVWYAVYGTNLNEERFSCYIKGGVPEGTSRPDTGCRDRTPAIDGGKTTLPFQLYFSKRSAKWENGSVGFLALKKDSAAKTLGRKYSIKRQQFEDIFKQSNGISVDREFPVDLEKVMEAGALTLSESWFGRIVFLGLEEGVPVFTLTAYWDFEPGKVSPPSGKYLAHFVKGLKQTYGFSEAQTAEYLADKPGMGPAK